MDRMMAIKYYHDTSSSSTIHHALFPDARSPSLCCWTFRIFPPPFPGPTREKNEKEIRWKEKKTAQRRECIRNKGGRKKGS